MRLELTTPCLKGRCSNRLSYGPVYLLNLLSNCTISGGRTSRCYFLGRPGPLGFLTDSTSNNATIIPTVITLLLYGIICATISLLASSSTTAFENAPYVRATPTSANSIAFSAKLSLPLAFGARNSNKILGRNVSVTATILVNGGLVTTKPALATIGVNSPVHNLAINAPASSPRSGKPIERRPAKKITNSTAKYTPRTIK